MEKPFDTRTTETKESLGKESAREDTGEQRFLNQGKMPPAKEDILSQTIGPVVGDAGQSLDAARQATERFFDAIAMSQMPDSPQASFTAKLVEMQAQQTEGVTRPQNIAYSNESGQTLVGVQFTKSDGTYFKTVSAEAAHGLTFRVEADAQFRFHLLPLDQELKPFLAVQTTVVPDLFAATSAEKNEHVLASPAKPLAEPVTVIDQKLQAEPGHKNRLVDRIHEHESSEELPMSLASRQQIFWQFALLCRERLSLPIDQIRDNSVPVIRDFAQLLSELLGKSGELANPSANSGDGKIDSSNVLKLRDFFDRNLVDISAEKQEREAISRTEYNVAANVAMENLLSNLGLKSLGSKSFANHDLDEHVEETNLVSHPPQSIKSSADEVTPKVALSGNGIEDRPDQPENKIEPLPKNQFDQPIVVNVGVHESTEPKDRKETAAESLEERISREESERLEQEAVKLRIQKRDEQRRRRYIVKEKETLESIALKQFRDVRVAGLIYQINKHLIPTRVIRGRKVQEVKARQVIFLPTNFEVERFRYGDTAGINLDSEYTSAESTLDDEKSVDSDDVTEASTKLEILDETEASLVEPELLFDPEDSLSQPDNFASQIADQSASVQSGPIRKKESEPAGETSEHVFYTVRLGDTLKSIAVRQPTLADPALWMLIAQINQLSTAVDETGSPEAKLVRGMRLKLPTKAELEAFRR